MGEQAEQAKSGIPFGNMRSAMVSNKELQDRSSSPKQLRHARTAMICEKDEDTDVLEDDTQVAFSAIRSSVLELDAEPCRGGASKRCGSRQSSQGSGESQESEVKSSLTQRIGDRLRSLKL